MISKLYFIHYYQILIYLNYSNKVTKIKSKSIQSKYLMQVHRNVQCVARLHEIE